MSLNKQFESAGKKLGLQVWRLEKMELVPVPTENYGSFYTGDAYLLLYTYSLSSPSYNIHSWTGRRFRFSADFSKQTLFRYRALLKVIYIL